MDDDEFLVSETRRRKTRRAIRIFMNARKHKRRDRYKSKPWEFVPRWERRIEPDWTFARVKAPTALGRGVAHEPRPRKDFI